MKSMQGVQDVFLLRKKKESDFVLKWLAVPDNE